MNVFRPLETRPFRSTPGRATLKFRNDRVSLSIMVVDTSSAAPMTTMLTVPGRTRPVTTWKLDVFDMCVELMNLCLCSDRNLEWISCVSLGYRT